MKILLECLEALVQKGCMSRTEADKTLAEFKADPAYLRKWANGILVAKMFFGA